MDDADESLDASQDSEANFNEDELTSAIRRRRDYQQKQIKEVDFHSLNIEQKELINCRLRLLSYLDRLKTYEDIKGGEERAARLYAEDDYRHFRSRNIVELAVEYARKSDWKEVDTLLTFHGKELLPFWLMILNEFPETTPPSEYKDLLPEICVDSGEVYGWRQQSFREPDWSEDPEVKNIIHPDLQDPGEEFFEDNHLIKRFRAEILTKEMLTDWYSFRIREIENQSHQVDNAIELAKLASERRVQELSNLYDDLKTLEVMVYEAGVDPNLTLEALEKIRDLDKIKRLMEKTPIEVYVKNMKRWVLPFLERCDAKTPGIRGDLLRDYILSTAKNDLAYCLQIFENCKPGIPQPIFMDTHDIVPLALECVYSCEGKDQHGNAQKVLNCLPKKGFGVIAEDMGTLYHDIEQLQHHLRAVEILLRRQIMKTARFIRDSELDSEKAEQLMIQLTRHASKPELAFKNIDWFHLLEDCMELRDKVYSCVDRKRCLEIYVASLLGSEKKSNIQLAGEFLAKAKHESIKVVKSSQKETKGAIQKQPTTSSTLFKLRLNKIPYESSVRLILSAAKEYFDASTKLMDTNMDLARACLELISESCPEIEEELDLIQSLSLLNTFSTPVLPLKVRLSENRLDLVKIALQSSPTAYKSSGKILDLARLLRVYLKDEAKEKGQVHVLIAETALKADDHHAAHQQCQAIIKDKHSEGWTVCKTLAEAKGFQNKEARQQLIAYALCYCDPSAIEEMLTLRTSNEIQMLGEILGISDDVKEEEPEEMAEEKEEEETIHEVEDNIPEKSMLQAALGKTTATTRQVLASTGATTRHVLASTGATTRHVLASTGATTKALLGTVSDVAFWKDSLKWVRPLSQSKQEIVMKSEEASSDVQWCHPFYQSVLSSSAQSSKDYPDYSQIHWTVNKSSPAYMNEALLRFSLLARGQQEGVTDETSDQHITGVLLQLAFQRLTSELSLTICYLLALMKPLAAEEFFDKMPRSEVTLQMAAYVYALQISAWIDRDDGAALATIYQTPCAALIDRVKDHVTNDKSSDWSEDLQALAKKFQLHVTLLDNFVQAQTLQKLGRGVDVARFTTDDEYKKDTILGLTMTLDDDVYDLSVFLAKKYKLSLWEVYMSHMEYLFTDSSLPINKIEERIKQLKLLPTLLSQPTDFCTRMQDYIYPSIKGSDHQSLLFYYTLLQGCKMKGIIHPPDVHAKLLKKIKNGVPRLDYKEMMEGHPYKTLPPVLFAANVHIMAKMANKIPNKDNGFLTSSQVFGIYVNKLFWQGDQGNKKKPETTADWLHRYEACGEFFSKLSPDEFSNFIKEVLFSKESLHMLELECRQKIIGRALKYMRQKGGSKQKFLSEVSEDEITIICATFQHYQKHLQSLVHESLLELKTIDEQNGSQYYSEYDLSGGDENRLKELISNLLCQGESVDLLQALIKVSSIENWTSAMNLKETLGRITEDVRRNSIHEESGSRQNHLQMDMLTKVIESVKRHIGNGGTVVNHTHVISILKPFCDDTDIPAMARVSILQLLDQTFDLSGEDSLGLLLSQTRALVSHCWTRKVQATDIQDEMSQFSLFKDLLSSANSFNHLYVLSKLLQQWAGFQSNGDQVVDGNPWMMLLEVMTQDSDFKGQMSVFLEIIGLEQCKNHLTKEDVERIYNILSSLDELLAGWKVILLCSQDSLYQQLVLDLKNITETAYLLCDSQFLELIIDRKLSCQMVETVFYPYLIEHVLQIEDGDRQSEIVNTVANELNENGYKVEGAALLLQFRGMHPMFHSLDTAFSVVSKWFQKRK